MTIKCSGCKFASNCNFKFGVYTSPTLTEIHDLRTNINYCSDIDMINTKRKRLNELINKHEKEYDQFKETCKKGQE